MAIKKVLVTARRFTEIVRKFKPNLDEGKFLRQFDNMSHGDFLAKKVNDVTGEEVVYFLKKVFIKKFDVYYGTTHSKKREMLISNMEMPPGNPMRDFK